LQFTITAIGLHKAHGSKVLTRQNKLLKILVKHLGTSNMAMGILPHKIEFSLQYFSNFYLTLHKMLLQASTLCMADFALKRLKIIVQNRPAMFLLGQNVQFR